MKRKLRFMLIFLLSFSGLLFSCHFEERLDNEKVEFQNPIIEQLVRENLGKLDGEPLTQEDVLSVKWLLRYKKMDDPETFDLQDISLLRNLEELELESYHLTNIEALGQLEHLAVLSLRKCDFERLPPLSNNRQLRMVDLTYATRVCDIDGLQGCSNLQELDITFTEISDISALSEMRGLRVLYARETPIRDISALRNVLLEELSLWGTRVSDLMPLSDMITLKYLGLRNTTSAYNWFQDGDESAKRQYNQLRESLPDCEIEWSISEMP